MGQNNLSKRFPRALIAVLAAALTLATATAVAAPQPVTHGELRWTQANVYETGAPAGTNRTWMGYVTSVGPPFTNGTVSATSPATGQSVSPASPRGADRLYPFVFPAASGGTYDPATGEGRIEFAGTVTFTSSSHGFTITLSNPLVELTGGSARLFASGQGTPRDGSPKPYGRGEPVFELGLGGATTRSSATGRTTEGAAPAIATPGLVWDEGSYPKGAGPDRTPNTFGSFSLEVRTGGDATPPPAPAPPPPPAPGEKTSAASTTIRPKVRCHATQTRAGRPRTRCTVTGIRGGRRVVASARGGRLASGAVRGARAVLVLPRARRAVTFKVVDARGRTLGRRTQTVGG